MTAANRSGLERGSSVKQFSAPGKFLGELDPAIAASLISVATDVALVIPDRESGVIRDIAFGNDALEQEIRPKWLGKPWADTVTSECRAKVQALLREAASGAPPRWRHLNHQIESGEDIPVMYTAVPLGGKRGVVAIGRSMREVAMLQRQLVAAQQAMDREYLRLRQVETRYRLLFQVSTEAVLIVEAATMKVVEANPATSKLVGDMGKRLIGRAVLDLFEVATREPVEALLRSVFATGKPKDAPVQLRGHGARDFFLSASLFREGREIFYLLRIERADKTVASVSGPKSKVLDIVQASPDGFLVTDRDGHVLMANQAFLDAAQLTTEEQALGQPVGNWLGRSGVDFPLMKAQLLEHGSLRSVGARIQGAYASVTDVEISAVAVPDGDDTCFGFTIREVSGKALSEKSAGLERPRSVEQLTAMVGRVPLKDLVRDSTDMIEKLCIETALAMTTDNRASAAEVLGLSRQSLYAKLRRYGLGDTDGEEADQAENDS
ncbi:MAG TPA: transcriptional regulator PpsR [Steroidobacteraceae bacterium]|nr:transcriptional regulator PpsR [Steroidobacteraceae bacterium]